MPFAVCVASRSCNIPAGQTQPIFPSDAVTFENTCDATQVGLWGCLPKARSKDVVGTICQCVVRHTGRSKKVQQYGERQKYRGSTYPA